MKRLAASLAAMVLLFAGTAAGESAVWSTDSRARLTVGNPTELTGRFFTGLWGGTTSDMDVQDLLQGYSLVRWDNSLVRFRFDHSVVQNAVAMDDADGNRTYLIVLYDDLRYSDGTPITARDYAFSVLFRMAPVIAETGGTPADFSWLVGAEEYLSGDRKELTGLRILSDRIIQLTVKAEALPYFYELYRLMFPPTPAGAIAPGTQVLDEGQGAYLSAPLDADTIRENVFDETTGLPTGPKVTSGPYVLKSFDGTTAVFEINPYYKGDEEGNLPRIGRLTYTAARHEDMISGLRSGSFGLLNKVAEKDAITAGLQNEQNHPEEFSFSNYPRTGLSMIWFCESSAVAQDFSVRKAIAYSLDRETFGKDYLDQYGIQVDGFYGLGQWMYQMAAGIIGYPVEEGEDTTAWEQISLDGLTRYAQDPEKAAALMAGREIPLTFGIPDTDRAEETIRKDFLPGLEEAGFRVTLRRLSMEELREVYDGKRTGFDMIFLGEDFAIAFDPDLLKPAESASGTDENGTENGSAAREPSLTEARETVYQLAREMVRTEPDDVLGFEQKWILLQEKITETLPLIPVYSNVYFDFYTRQLHEYNITDAVSWGEAIVPSYISDMEKLKKNEEEKLFQDLNQMGEEYRIENPAR